MIIVRFKMQVQPGKAEQAMALLTDVVLPSRAVEGVVSFDIARDLVDSNSFIATEVFDDHAALARQESLPEVARVMEAFPDLLVGDPEATVFEVSSPQT